MMSRRELDRLFKRIERVSGITRYIYWNKFFRVCRNFFLF